jgi:hypothetical protein
MMVIAAKNYRRIHEMTILCARIRRLFFSHSRNSMITSADFLDYLPEMNERGLILPKIHLEPIAISVLDDGLNRRVYDPALCAN